MVDIELRVPTPFTHRTAVKGIPDIRLDAAMRWSHNQFASAGTNSVIELYNNSPQGQYIVLRCFSIGPAAALPVQSGYKVGRQPGGPSGGGSPFMPDRANLPGIVTGYYLVSFFAPADFVFYSDPINSGWISAFPFAVLPPNWAIQFASGTANQTLTMSWVWEVLTPEQFAESYGMYS